MAAGAEYTDNIHVLYDVQTVYTKKVWRFKWSKSGEESGITCQQIQVA